MSYSIWGFWPGIALSLPPLPLAFPRYLYTPGCRHSPPSTRVETQQAKEQHPSSRPQEKLPLHGWKLQWRWLGQAQQVRRGGRRQGGVWRCGCHCIGTRGAWECDGVASDVPILASGSHGKVCWWCTSCVGPPPHCQVTLSVALWHLCQSQVTFVSAVRVVSAAWTTGSYHVSYSCHVKAAVFS